MTTKQLQRTTFSTSRLLDFASAKELTAQTGHAVDDWPLVIVKELLDNAHRRLRGGRYRPCHHRGGRRRRNPVSDNGPGLPASTIDGCSTSRSGCSREAYVSPTRGAQGNALKTIVAMPFVLATASGARSRSRLAARALHRLPVDRIRQAPVSITRSNRPIVIPGRRSRPLAELCLLNPRRRRGSVLQIADDFAWLNPTCRWSWTGSGRGSRSRPPGRLAKWKPSDPTSPHWYDPERLQRLIAAYVAHDADTRSEPHGSRARLENSVA